MPNSIKKHKVGDLLLFSCTPYNDRYNFGIIVDVDIGRNLPFHIIWFDMDGDEPYMGYFTSNETERFKRNLNFLKKHGAAANG